MFSEEKIAKFENLFYNYLTNNFSSFDKKRYENVFKIYIKGLIKEYSSSYSVSIEDKYDKERDEFFIILEEKTSLPLFNCVLFFFKTFYSYFGFSLMPKDLLYLFCYLKQLII